MHAEMPAPRSPQRRLLAVFLLSLGLTLLAAPALATHRVDQRFTVWGQVTDANGAPVADHRVRIIVADGFSVEQVRTNADGWYRKVLAVSDADLGKVFDVQVGLEKVRVKVEFDPGDRETERGSRVDFTLPEGQPE